MQVRSFIKRLIPFLLALALGIGTAGIFVEKDGPLRVVKDVEEGKCLSAGHPLPCLDGPVRPVQVPVANDPVKTPCTGTCGVKILSKPRAGYTEGARTNNIKGSVILRVAFLGSGQIGAITVISGLPYGLNEQAIAAARGIKFQPATENGVPFSASRTVQYSFTIY